MTQRHLWYVKRGGIVTGPFPIALVERNIASGRLRADDLLSDDGQQWSAARDTPSFADIVIGQQARAGRARFDQRESGCDSELSDGRAAGVEPQAIEERRREEPPDILSRRALSQRVWQSMRADRPDQRGPLVAIAISLLVIGLLGVVFRTPEPGAAPDCGSAPRPAVNWDFCQKPGADLKQADLRGISARNARLSGGDLAGANLAGANLAYADLATTTMQLADLSRARLIGANLRAADLSYANLRAADLQFVDLRDAELRGANFGAARLGNAIWSDGRRCARDSVGMCLAARPGAGD